MNKQKPSVALATSHTNIPILMTTLRLLDCDKLHDWTSISTQVMVSRDAGPNQKRRIENAEWILYHLFNIWDNALTLEVRRIRVDIEII